MAALLAIVGSTQAANADITLSDVTGGATLYGYRLSPDDGVNTGDWGVINTDGSFTVKWHDDCTYLVQNGWIRRGQFLEIGAYVANNIKFGIATIARNLETGEITDMEEYDITTDPKLNYSSSTYLAATDSVYGFVMDPEFSYYPVWKRAPGNGALYDIQSIQKLADPYTWCPVLCPADDGKSFYGITFKSKLVKIDNEGNETEIFDLPVTAKGSNTAMVYFPATKKLLWSGVFKDGTTALYGIDPVEKTCELVTKLENGVYFSMFAFGEQLDVATIPGKPTDMKLDIKPGSSEGSLEFKMPTTTAAGEKITRTMTYKVQIDSEPDIIQASGCEAGSNVKLHIGPLANGKQTIKVWAELDGVPGPESVVSQFIGNDTPMATLLVSLYEVDMKLTAQWEPVTEGVNGGYLDLEKLSYNVYLNGELKANTKEIIWEYQLPADAELQGYNVTITAICNGLESSGTVSNSVACGQPMTPNVYIAPTAAESALMTYIGDGEAKWKYNDSYEPAVFSSGSHYVSEEPLNTWMFLPPIKLKAASEGGKYSISCKSAVMWDFRDKDYFTVYIGKENTVEAMTKEIVERQNPTLKWPENSQVEKEFTVDESGVYYIGFHCTSEPSQSGALVWDIAVNDLNGGGVAAAPCEAFRVSSGIGFVDVFTQAEVTVEIFAIDGRLVASTKVDGNGQIALPAGIYVLRADNHTQKIIIR